MNLTDRTLRREDGGAQGPADEPRWHLFRVLECNEPLSGGARFALGDIDEVVVGRAAGRHARREGRRLTIGVPDPMMSSTHARLERMAPWQLRDAGSTNGTVVNGARVDSVMLDDGALIEMGGTLFTLRREPTRPDSPDDVDSANDPSAIAGMTSLSVGYARRLAALEQVMRSPLPILLLGETGTGKEVLARAVHAVSGRRGAFVGVNCGAIPETLIESQLFGHTRGAFSGAVRDEPGLVRAASGGTLFLDEVGDLPRASQAALLRVLQESEVQAVGASRAEKVDLRVVSATHRPIDTLEQAGFRTDLYARLAGYVHALPAVRERREDLGVIVAGILRSLAPDRGGTLKLTPELARALFASDWPLNVRQLKNALATALVFAKDGTIRIEHVPEDVRVHERTALAEAPISDSDARLRDSLLAALLEHKGNVTHVARAMGCTRMQVHRWMRRFQIDPAALRR